MKDCLRKHLLGFTYKEGLLIHKRDDEITTWITIAAKKKQLTIGLFVIHGNRKGYFTLFIMAGGTEER